jgi:hypothetical protein
MFNLILAVSRSNPSRREVPGLHPNFRAISIALAVFSSL